MERARLSRSGVRNKHAANGHCIGYTQDPSSGELHVVGSIVTQLQQGSTLETGLHEQNMRYRKVAGRGRRNVLFVIDTSGSTLAADRLALVKGCVISLLQDAYVKRTRVAIVGYGGAHARLVLPFTSSSEMAAKRIGAMPGGGGTPLVDALALAAGLIDRVDGEPVEIILLSDGRYNRNRASAERLIRSFGGFCKRKGIPVHLVDASSGGKTALKRIALLSGMLKADIRTLDDLRMDQDLSG